MENNSPQEDSTSQAKKILIIEDEFFISELYVRALKKVGYDVILAVDGEDGLQKALTDSFDIILLDIMVPTLTGNEILAQLRQRQPPIKAKIVITTNLEQSEETKKQLEQQADGYIIKAEITPKQLVEFLNSV